MRLDLCPEAINRATLNPYVHMIRPERADDIDFGLHDFSHYALHNFLRHPCPIKKKQTTRCDDSIRSAPLMGHVYNPSAQL